MIDARHRPGRRRGRFAAVAALVCAACGGGLGVYDLDCKTPTTAALSSPASGFELTDSDGSRRYYVLNADANQSYCGAYVTALDESGKATTATLLRYEGETLRLAGRAVTDGASVAFIAERADSTILLARSVSGQLKPLSRVALYMQPGPMIYDAARQTLYVASVTTSTLAAVDTKSGEVRRRIRLQDTDAHPARTMMLGPDGNVWVGYLRSSDGKGGYFISRYDPDHDRFLPLLRPLGTADAQSPSEMLTVGDRLWAAFPTEGVVLAFDRNGDTVGSTTEFFTPTALRAADGRVFIGDLDRFVWVDEEFHPLRFYDPIAWAAPAVALYLSGTEEFVTASFTDVSLTKVAVPR